jgi:asparagine synthase (glutamine-hydrolysing)
MEHFEHRFFDEYSQNYISQLFGNIRDKTYYRGMYYLQGKLHLPNLLNRLDRMTMASSIEARVPFLDHEFVEFVSRIPLHYKLRWNNTLSRIQAIRMDSNSISEKLDTPKFILKRLAQGKIPEGVIWRKKMGFPVPLDLWFNKEMRTHALEVLTDGKAKIRDFINTDGIKRLLEKNEISSYYDYDGKKIWMLMNLEMWMQKYFSHKGSLI